MTEDQSLLVDTFSEKQAYLEKPAHPGRPYATVVTFNPHPRQFFTGQSRQLLTPPAEKIRQLHLLGVEQLVMLPFDQEMAVLSPEEFVEKILVRQLRARQISVGQDFCFGHRRAGTSADLQALAAKYDVEVIIVAIQNCEGERISSSIIREHLQAGEIERANHLLGRPYSLTGIVVKGQQLGRTLGFPTANLQISPDKLLPRLGVYAVTVSIEQADGNTTTITAQAKSSSYFPVATASTKFLPGVVNIGTRPTVNGSTPTVEVHLLDWSGDLYGKTLSVNLEKFLRPEQKFPSLEALKEQIQTDCAIAKSLLE